MHRMKFRLSALAAAFCAVLAFALFGVVAQAEEAYAFKLTVNATASTDEHFVDEIKRAKVDVDVYLIATAAKDPNYDTYNYTWNVTEFAGLETQFSTIAANRESTASDWQKLYDAAGKIVADSKGSIKPVATLEMVNGKAVFADEKALTEKGIYLVMARGVDEEAGSGIAYSDRYKFTFPATMIAVPTKWANDSGDMASTIYTDWSYGIWRDEATINLKSSQEPLFGRLIIDKEITEGYEEEEVTFVFRVRNIATSEVGLGEIYDEYASITLNGSSTGTTQLTHIPAQIRVQIEETYEGGRYKYVSTEWLTDNVIVSDHDVEKAKGDTTIAQYAEVLVKNKRGGDNPGGGHGVENHFSYDDTTLDWPWEMRPNKPYTPEVA